MNSFTFHITLGDLAAVAAIITGLNFALLLTFTKSVNRRANRFLSLALITMVSGMTCLVATDVQPATSISNWLPLLLSLTAGPLIYFYVLKIARSGHKFCIKELLHFSPSLLPGTLLFNFKQDAHLLSPVLQLMPLISITCYLYYAHELIPRFQKEPGNNITDRHRHELWRLRRLLSRFILLGLLWIPYNAITCITNHYRPGIQSIYSVQILLAVILISLAAVAFSWPEVRLPAPMPPLPKHSPSTELAQKGAWLKAAMKASMFYRDPEISLSSLAEKLDIHPHELSRIINTALKKNFNDFINEYRVRDVILKFQDPAYDRVTLLGMAMDSGFNSKSTFNRIFKEMTGKTPVEYKASLEKQLPTYKLTHTAPFVPVVLRHETTHLWSQQQKNHNTMFRTYIKTAWRNIAANKLLATLNIAGLAIGICVCITLFACASYELSFDRMYKNSKNIYRINLQTGAQFNNQVWAQLPGIAGPAFAQSIPQVKATARLLKHDFGSIVSIKTDEKNFSEKGLYMSDTSVFRIFDFTFTEGNAKTAFAHPKSIVISESAKERLYGNAPAYGKIIYVENQDTLYVSGVYKDLPQNSTIDCDMIYNIMDSWAGKQVYWGNSSYETYCLLQPGANLQQVQKLCDAVADKNDPKKGRFFDGFILQPLADIHLYSADIRAGFSARIGRISTVKVLLLLSLLVMGIACINYMNLATARSEKRAKGVGVNKVLGADRRHLLALFYTETAVLAFIAIVIGYAACFVLQPFFQGITGMQLAPSALFTITIAASLLLAWVVVTLIAGSYPAFSMARISPLVLMNKLRIKHSVADAIRKSLVVFQFASSIILIIAVIVILQQMNYIRNKDLGYSPNGIVAVSIKAAQNKDQVSTFVNGLKSMASVESATPSQSLPGDVESGKSIRKSISDNASYPVRTCRTDGSIIKTMRFKLLAGATIPLTLAATDTNCYLLINESVMRYLGYKTPQDAIGKYAVTEMHQHAIITGVVKDFNYETLKNEIGGYVYYITNKRTEPLNTMLIRYNSHDLPNFVKQVQNVFKAALPNSSFDFEFLDTHIQNLYVSEQHTASTATIFSMLAIFVACLGLFGLAASIAEQRTKEIGIRKVLGASVPGITRLLTGDFVKLVIISIAIASPVAWFMMNKWLMQFSYREHISVWAFVIAGLAAVVLALLTISSHAIKTAMANPVKSLRSE